jgi:2-keto-3-deoxy-L-rhamnonate aldolase RhmA
MLSAIGFAADNPNIIIFLADDLGYADIGVNGCKDIPTPNIDAIAATPGVDALFVGPFDLSLSMGKAGQVEDPAVMEAIARVEAAGRARGLPLGYFGISPENVGRWMTRGFTLIACGVDMMMLGAKAREVQAALMAIPKA